MKMSSFAYTAALLSLCLLSLPLVGCGKSTSAPSVETPSATADPHDHPSEGPHHGALIELGSEEYHAELVHDEAAGSVTVFLLDSSAKNSVPIDAAELIVNLSHEGNAEQFKLSAKPDAQDPPGKSSRFVSIEAELAEQLDHEHSQAQLVVSINGKQFRGAIAHDHEEHDHEAHDHEAHDH